MNRGKGIPKVISDLTLTIPVEHPYAETTSQHSKQIEKAETRKRRRNWFVLKRILKKLFFKFQSFTNT